MKGIIYTATNTVNGKIYVGQTTQHFKDRIRQHEYVAVHMKFNSHFYSAIRKNGFDAFNWEIIGRTNDITVLNALEILFIDLFDSNNKKKGYNIREGGYNGKHSEGTKRKISKAMKGRKHSEESKRKMSKAQSGKKKSNHRHDLKDDLIINLYKKGKSLREIGKKLNCYPSVIRYHLQKNRIKRRNRRDSKIGNGIFKFTGIHLDKRSNPEKKCWESRISYNGKSRYLGRFPDPLSGEIFYTFSREEIERLEGNKKLGVGGFN